MGLVSSGSDSDPSSSLGACAKGAVVLGPSRISVRASVANALVVSSARSVAGAPVRAVSSSKSSKASEGNEKEGAGHGVVGRKEGRLSVR